MSHFKKKFFFSDQNKHDFQRFGMLLYNFGKKKFSKKFLSPTFLSIGMTMSFFQPKKISKFFSLRYHLKCEIQWFGMFLYNFGPNPPPSIGKKISYFFSLIQKIYTFDMFRSKFFFHLQSTLGIAYIRESFEQYIIFRFKFEIFEILFPLESSSIDF